MAVDIWTAYEAAAATGGVLCAKGGHTNIDDDCWPEESWAATGLSIDSRTLKPGEIFVALKDVRDGHDFVEAAFKKGAAAALVSRPPENAPKDKPLLLVRDTLGGLECLAAAARDRCFGRMIAVTGSVGKTSVKEMLRTALMASGKVHAANKSFNNHFGVPLTLASLPSDSDFGIFEIGMNHAGEITPLSQLVQPHVAVITTVAPAHLEFFDSVEAIARAKAEIFSGLRRDGVAILPRDNEYFDLLAATAKARGARIISFGQHQQADYRLLDYHPTANGGEVHVSFDQQDIMFPLSVPGRHQAINALAVLAVLDQVGGDRGQALRALADFSAVDGRGQTVSLVIDEVDFTLIDESYNANPASMSAALDLLASKPGRRIAILGDMLELGDEAAALHLALAEPLRQASVAKVFCAGAMMKKLYQTLPEEMRGGWAETARDLEVAIVAEIRPRDILMAKGSNASRVSALVAALMHRADVNSNTKKD